MFTSLMFIILFYISNIFTWFNIQTYTMCLLFYLVNKADVTLTLIYYF